MHQPIDDHFLLKYRALLDAEDLAFDELEHACEDGDRMQFDKDMVDWQNALEHKLVFLANAGIEREAARSGLSDRSAERRQARRIRASARPSPARVVTRPGWWSAKVI